MVHVHTYQSEETKIGAALFSVTCVQKCSRYILLYGLGRPVSSALPSLSVHSLIITWTSTPTNGVGAAKGVLIVRQISQVFTQVFFQVGRSIVGSVSRSIGRQIRTDRQTDHRTTRDHQRGHGHHTNAKAATATATAARGEDSSNNKQQQQQQHMRRMKSINQISTIDAISAKQTIPTNEQQGRDPIQPDKIIAKEGAGVQIHSVPPPPRARAPGVPLPVQHTETREIPAGAEKQKHRRVICMYLN